jgi:dolichol-phosphate mannosyltransferase
VVFSLIIPTYNEAHNIKPLIHQLIPILNRAVDDFEVVIVDDDSPDLTWQLAQEIADREPRVRVIRRVNQRGLATAVVAGWDTAKGEILGVMDGDLQHDPETLSKMLRAIQATPADIIIASRHINGGGVSDWSFIRRSISWGATCLATLVIPGILRNVVDPMSGYFILRRSVINSARLEPTGYKILLEVLAKGNYQYVEEIPYVFEERREGASKLGLKQYWEYLIHLIRLTRQTGELLRFCRFCLVGATGILVNQGTLWALTAFGDMYYINASAGAVQLAILSNFFLNEFWTFRDRTSRSLGAWARLYRLYKFNVICVIGGILNTAALWVLTEQAGIHYLYGNLVGMALGTIWNYLINSNMTWGILSIRDLRGKDGAAVEPRDVTTRKVLDERRHEV